MKLHSVQGALSAGIVCRFLRCEAKYMVLVRLWLVENIRAGGGRAYSVWRGQGQVFFFKTIHTRCVVDSKMQ
jgi:hypothetical protein